ncbi:MAG TPA: cytidylate kinase-like family protein, partial [Dehalococcoidia bacterium]|nr:cytidylate kinase-like family protein [Dehalococcoidia bacterium]
EHTPSLLTRVLESLARSPGVPTVTWADPVPVSTHPLYTSADYRELVGEVIRDVADKGDCVIIGHGAHRFLRSRGDTLRVFITGSAAHRLRRVTSHMAADENTAQKALEGSDSERSDYFKRFFDIDWRDASNYDITLSTDTLSPEGVAEIISLAARLR